MRVTVERIDRHEVWGWACDDIDFEQVLTVTVRLHGEVVGEALANLPRSRRADGEGHQSKGFVVRTGDLGDIVSALADGGLTIEAQREAAGAVAVTFNRHLLSPETLRSAQDLFGGVVLDQVLDRLQTIAGRSANGVYLGALCFDLISFVRAYFPANRRDARFYALAVELSRAAGMTHSARFYERKLESGDAVPLHDDGVRVFDADVLGEKRVSTYALPSDPGTVCAFAGYRLDGAAVHQRPAGRFLPAKLRRGG